MKDKILEKIRHIYTFLKIKILYNFNNAKKKKILSINIYKKTTKIKFFLFKNIYNKILKI